MGYFGEFGYGSKTALGSTYVVKQLLFSMVPSFLTILVILTSWGSKGLFLGWGKFHKLFLGLLICRRTAFFSFFLILLLDLYSILG